MAVKDKKIQGNGDCWWKHRTEDLMRIIIIPPGTRDITRTFTYHGDVDDDAESASSETFLKNQLGLCNSR